MNEKLFSGKFLLCVSAALCLVLLTITACIAILTQSGDNPIVLALVALLSNILTGITTHYFTKRADA